MPSLHHHLPHSSSSLVLPGPETKHIQFSPCVLNGFVQHKSIFNYKQMRVGFRITVYGLPSVAATPKIDSTNLCLPNV